MVRQWLWCLECERCFPVDLPRPPKLEGNEEADEDAEDPLDFIEELEQQLSVKKPDGEVVVQCPYDDCNAPYDEWGDFEWWEEFRKVHPEAPTDPKPGEVYSYYPLPTE